MQLIHGPAGQGAELADATIVPMTPAGPADDGHLRYAGAFTCEQAGRYGATVRVVPAPPRPRHPRGARPHRLGLTLRVGAGELGHRREIRAGNVGLAGARARGSS